MIEINSLWIGPKLSDLEVLSIKSHLFQGHKYNLWCYDVPENVPIGTDIMDGNEILPKEEIFQYQVGRGKGSYSAFSNSFRYKLLHEKGGWWSDTDVVALKPFDFESDYVFASERTQIGGTHPTTCVIKAPKGSEMMDFCFKESMKHDKSTLEWGTIGPSLIKKAIFSYRKANQVQDPSVFCPVDWFCPGLDSFSSDEINLTKSYSVHLWNEMWRRKGIDKNEKQEENTLYEKLKRDYLYSHS
jgi:hypothetical protein